MDYINSNFISLGDLDDIDTHINTLSLRKLSLTRQIQKKANNDLPANLSDSHASELVEILRQRGPLASIDEIDLLLEKYGNISALRSLRQRVLEKERLEQEKEELLQAIDTESQVNSLNGNSSVEDIKKVSGAIDDIPDKELQAELRSQLTEALQPLVAAFTAKLKTHLESIKWLAPQEKIKIPAHEFKAISGIFAELVDLQAVVRIPQYPESWLALDVLINPFVVRFNYHFNEASETNKISRPEWALSYWETFFTDQRSLLELIIGSTFTKFERIATFELLTALLVPVREKLSHMVSLINTSIEKPSGEKTTESLHRDGRLLSHLIFETASFDQRLRKNFKFNPYITSLKESPSRKWTGLTGDVLISNNGENNAVENWLSLEYELAKSRFDRDILGVPNAFDIDYEFNASSDNPDEVLKPSYSAYALIKLFDNLTTHFKSLSVAKYQLKYVSKIQLEILNVYYNSLKKEFGHFNDSLGLKLIANFLPGGTKPDSKNPTQEIATNGLKGLEILTGLYCLVKFLICKMEDWSTELVYIQLWNVYTQLSHDYNDEGSIFGSTIVQYNYLLQKVLSKYGEFFEREIRAVLKEYINSSTWVIEEDTRNQPSPHLSNFIDIIPRYMQYLKRTLPKTDYFLISSKVCGSFAETMLKYVISSSQFNKNGLRQLKVDFEFLKDHIEGMLLMSENSRYSNHGNRQYKRLSQSIALLEYFDATTAKLLKRNVDSNQDIRLEFADGLDCLTDNDLRDLLYRIV